MSCLSRAKSQNFHGTCQSPVFEVKSTVQNLLVSDSPLPQGKFRWFTLKFEVENNKINTNKQEVQICGGFEVAALTRHNTCCTELQAV
jgi:hypothetical protein